MNIINNLLPAITNIGAVDCGFISDITRPLAHMINIIAPALVIVLGAVDFLGAVTASDDKGLKKAFNTFMKRLAICIVIMILPLLVNMVISFTTFNDLTSCL